MATIIIAIVIVKMIFFVILFNDSLITGINSSIRMFIIISHMNFSFGT